MSSNDNKQTNLEWLGYKRWSEIRKVQDFGGFLGWLLMALALILICAAFITLYDFLRAGLRLGPYANDGDGSAIRNIGLVLAALLGAPFVIWRSYVAAKQARIQDEALFNDKINAASRDLSARRQTTREVNNDATKTILTEWQDDLVTRAAAIDRLEGLAQERPDETPRIARMLSVYVRELSREFPAKEHPRHEWQRLIAPGDGTEPMSDTQALHHLGLSPDDVSIDALKSWARGLDPIRSDMEKAAQTLGRLKTVRGDEFDDVPIDLRGANLQGFDLTSSILDKALLQGARMEGANFAEARMEGANLYEARMEGAFLFDARMKGANLFDARMEGADLSWARFSGKTTFQLATLRGASWKAVDCSNIPQIVKHLDDIFGDGSVTLPEGTPWPDHWPKEDLNAYDYHTQWRAFQRSIGYTPPA
ncbi:pentapeptide repeat-containing protein [Rhodobacteraceae bacterium D3-12]|nr:pentapeptide repeat-containing protein [Rhodobacteraceae bacterium D3-12]